MNSFAYINATQLEKVPSLLSTKWGEAVVIAGGTDLLCELKERLISPERLVNLKSVPNLKYINAGAKGLRIGAMTTLSAVEKHREIRKSYTVLALAAASIASPQIRNQGTVGGNLCQRPRCWYFRGRDFVCLKKGGDRCFAATGDNRYNAIFGGGPSYIVHPSDSAPALVALNASVKVVGPGGTKNVRIEDFFVLPDTNLKRENILKPNEIISEVSVPAPAPGTKGVYIKIREKQSLDFAITSVACVLTMSGGVCKEARIVLGGVAPMPWRCTSAEGAVKGKKIDADIAAKAGEAATEGALPLSHNAYKVHLVRTVVKRAVLAASA